MLSVFMYVAPAPAGVRCAAICHTAYGLGSICSALQLFFYLLFKFEIPSEKPRLLAATLAFIYTETETERPIAPTERHKASKRSESVLIYSEKGHPHRRKRNKGVCGNRRR
jgi:hypothetical protein